MLPCSLTVSIVTYRPDSALLERCLAALAQAIFVARKDGAIEEVMVAIIDNSEDREIAVRVMELGNRCFRASGIRPSFLHGHANIGYGAANNLVLHGSGSDYHLVLNPDLELAPDALANGTRWLEGHPEFGAVAPSVRSADGTPEYLCKRYPAVFDFLLRGFAPGFVRIWFSARLARYELRDRIELDSNDPVIGIPVMSGACMLVRRTAIDATGGFDPRFFLYFEDYDWSVRINRIAQTAYLPAMSAVHHGGHAAHKGPRHVAWFVKSAIRFYNKHGWRWV